MSKGRAHSIYKLVGCGSPSTLYFARGLTVRIILTLLQLVDEDMHLIFRQVLPTYFYSIYQTQVMRHVKLLLFCL